MKLGCKKFFVEGLCGLVPLLNWVVAIGFVFNSTEWAKQYPGLVVFLLTPAFCLINSKIIVCNCTNMESEPVSMNFCIYLLFNANKSLSHSFSEGFVAATIFAMELTSYSIFVYCTIRQICNFLDIYCLTIKKKTAQGANEPASTASSVQGSPKQAPEETKQGPEASAETKKAKPARK